MHNPHQELLDQFQTLNTKIERLESILQTKNSNPEPTPEKDILLTPKELAFYWNCTVATIHNKRKKGEIEAQTNGRIIRFSKKAIDKISKLK